jgi:hypothetical protein
LNVRAIDKANEKLVNLLITDNNVPMIKEFIWLIKKETKEDVHHFKINAFKKCNSNRI